MRFHLPWFLLILSIVVAFPENENKTTHRFENGSLPLVIPQRTTLDDLLKAYNIQGLENQELNRIKRSSCPIDKKLLETLTVLIKKIRNYVPPQNQRTKAVIPEASPELGTRCDIARNRLSHNLNALVKVFQIMLFNGPMLKKEEFQNLKLLYVDLVSKSKEYFQILEDTEEPDVREVVNGLLHEKKLFEARVDTIVEKIELSFTTQEKSTEDKISDIISTITKGRYELAIQKLHEVRNYPVTIYEIVDKMEYSEKHNEDLLVFIRSLRDLSHSLMGYEAMLNKNQFRYSIITLEHHFLTLLKQGGDVDVIRELQGSIDFVKEKTEELVKKRIEKMAELIATKTPKDYRDMIEFTKGRKEAFDEHLEELVEKVYEIMDNDVDIIERILAFSDALTQFDQSGRVYVKLYKLMEHNRKIAFESSLKIGFKVKELFLMDYYKHTSEEVKKAMLELSEKLPPSVKSIIWGQVCIKNEELGAFLHSNGPYDSSRKNINLAHNKDLWEFEGTKNAESFRMRHVATKEYLYAESDELSYSTFKRRLFTRRKINAQLINQFWLLEDLQWREGKFLIKNKIRNEYLNAEEIPDAEPASRIKQWMTSSENTDDLQAFTWRKWSKGKNPEWLLVDSSNC